MRLDPIGRDAEETLAYFSLTARERVEALLIDDDAVDAAIIIRLASKSKQLDFHVKTCGSTEDARRMIALQAFDVVYVDYWMGRETSISFINELTKSSRAPCVLLTGLDEPDIRRLGFRAGVKGFLSKEDISTQALEGVTLAVFQAKADASAL